MFMSCKQVALQNKPKPVDIDKFRHFDVCLFQIMSCFVKGTVRPGTLLSYEPMSCCLSRKINTSEKNQTEYSEN